MFVSIIQPSGDTLASVKALLCAETFFLFVCFLARWHTSAAFLHSIIYSDSQVMNQRTGETVRERGKTNHSWSQNGHLVL